MSDPTYSPQPDGTASRVADGAEAQVVSDDLPASAYASPQDWLDAMRPRLQDTAWRQAADQTARMYANDAAALADALGLLIQAHDRLGPQGELVEPAMQAVWLEHHKMAQRIARSGMPDKEPADE